MKHNKHIVGFIVTLEKPTYYEQTEGIERPHKHMQYRSCLLKAVERHNKTV